MEKSKVISRKGKEFSVMQRRNEEAIPSRGANLNSFRLIKKGKVFLEDYSYVVPWQMAH